MENQINTMQPGADMGVVNVASLKARFDAIQQLRTAVMQAGKDYYSLQNKKEKDASGNEVEVPQFSLSKAGAETLAMAFNLSTEIDSQIVSDDPARETQVWVKVWQINPTTSRKERVDEKRIVYGTFEVKSICTVYSPGGRPIAKASGFCSSLEAGFHGMACADSKNGVIKRAEKRALVAAMLQATGASRMFTQDLEDMDEAERNWNAPGGASGGTTTGGWLSTGQQNLIRAKGSKAGHPKAVVEYVISTLQGLGKKDGKKYFDQIADDKPEAAAVWQKAAASSAPGKKQQSAPEPPPPPEAPPATAEGAPEDGALPPPPPDSDGF